MAVSVAVCDAITVTPRASAQLRLNILRGELWEDRRGEGVRRYEKV